MKTFKGWQKSGTDLAEYLGEEPVRIDEELYQHISDHTGSNYAWLTVVQSGETEFSDQMGPHHITATAIDDKYFYLGILPSFV